MPHITRHTSQNTNSSFAHALTVAGRYITLLNTVSNIGGLVPQTGIMFVAEWVQSMVGQEAGYYSCVCGCVALGFALMPVMVKLVRSVETLPLSEWRVHEAAAGICEMQSSSYARLSREELTVDPQHSE